MVIAFLRTSPAHHEVNPHAHIKGGEYNGYVAFDKELPASWQGSAAFDDSKTLDNLVDVHGGITYDNSSFDWETEAIIPITSIPDLEFLKKCRVIGFDTLHCNDTKERWPIEAVRQETIRLMEQIKKLCNGY